MNTVNRMRTMHIFGRFVQRWWRRGVASLIGILMTQAVAVAQPAEGIDPADAPQKGEAVPVDFVLRARLTKITPDEPTDINWICGKDNRGKLSDAVKVGEWSPSVPVASFNKGRLGARMYLKLEAGRKGQARERALRDTPDAPKVDYSRDAEMEIEFSYGGKVVKTIKIAGPKGGVFTVMIPGQKLVGGVTPASREFLDELVSVGEYAKMRLALLESQPWAKWPVPSRFLFITDCRGYGIGGNGWTTDIETFGTELKIARQLGVNGLRQPNQTSMESLTSGKGVAREFNRGLISVASGYPVARPRPNGQPNPEAGCPFGPGVPQRMAEGLVKARDRNVNLPVPEVWALTADEINPTIMQSDAVRQHTAICDNCAEGYRQYIKSIGLTPADFGKKNWADVRPLDVWGPNDPAKKATWKMPDVSSRHDGLAAYHSMEFVGWASARLFESMRDQFDALNREKRDAMATGDKSTPATTRPYVYSYALRGQNFIAGGHPLDFFNFYRHADNAFVYETSSRGAQIWSWDDYLLNVGRVVSGKMNKQLGVYVKPHRGAPMQRALSAVSHGA